MTVRSRFHTRAVTNLAYRLKDWLESCPQQRGEVHTGEVGCVLRRDPETLVGMDVAYFSAEVMERQTDETTLIEGPPTLAIEVLSPSDRTEDVQRRRNLVGRRDVARLRTCRRQPLLKSLAIRDRS